MVGPLDNTGSIAVYRDHYRRLDSVDEKQQVI